MIHDYILNSQIIEVAEQHSYLGIMLNKSLSWSSHISTISSKATRTLNFLKRNLSNCSRKVKESAYLTMVRPQMEYASAVWDPHHNSLIQLLEKVQRRAARWIFNDYQFSLSYVEWIILACHQWEQSSPTIHFTISYHFHQQHHTNTASFQGL